MIKQNKRIGLEFKPGKYAKLFAKLDKNNDRLLIFNDWNPNGGIARAVSSHWKTGGSNEAATFQPGRHGDIVESGTIGSQPCLRCRFAAERIIRCCLIEILNPNLPMRRLLNSYYEKVFDEAEY
ncbi:MAG: hypothetical protein K9M45_05730 [Kiritimatiellales bacterium]|nr:hypothetical protein [Kiritimatiellales bacterium]